MGLDEPTPKTKCHFSSLCLEIFHGPWGSCFLLRISASPNWSFFFSFSSNLVLSFSLLRSLLTDKWFLFKKNIGSFLFLGSESMLANGKMGIVKKKNNSIPISSKEKTSMYELLFSWIKMFTLICSSETDQDPVVLAPQAHVLCLSFVCGKTLPDE